jgi:hypothetical protein
MEQTMKGRNITWVTVRLNIFRFIVTATLWIISNFSCANEWHISQVFESRGSISSPVIAVDGDRVAHVAWIENSRNSTLYYANSKDDWLPLAITNISYHFVLTPSIFVDKNNSVYIAWVDPGYDGQEMNCNVYYASSLDGWVSHLVIADSIFSCHNPSIAVGNDGDIYITFIHETTDVWPNNDKLFFTKKSSGWTEERISFTGFNSIGWSDMDIDKNDVVHVVFSNKIVAGDPSHNSHIWYTNSANGWTNIQVDSNETLNIWDNRECPSIDVDSYNTAHVVWSDRRNTALQGDPAYHNSRFNRSEIYYANASNNWVNSEIALPIDTNGPRVKQIPSIFIQDNIIHTIWLQRETYIGYDQVNMLYSNSNNWDNAVNITNLPNIPIHIEPPPHEMPDPDLEGIYYPSYLLSSSANALSVDKNGISHVTWKVINRKNLSEKIYYATYSALQSCDCANPRAIKGTSGQDFLFGTTNADIICGFDGQDLIVGRSGDDCIDGGDGDDWIFGGIGNDKLYGGEGYDWLFCGSGTDEGSGENNAECEI